MSGIGTDIAHEKLKLTLSSKASLEFRGFHLYDITNLLIIIYYR